MSECPPSGAVQDPAGQHPAALSPERIDAILADFRTWLAQATDPPANTPATVSAPSVDLHTLLGQLTALRHEVHLQTRALRGQQELTGETLRQYGQTLETLRASEPAADADAGTSEEEVVRPLLKHLVDARDALALARVQVERVGATLHPSAESLGSGAGTTEQEVSAANHDQVPLPAAESPRHAGFFQRLFGRSTAAPASDPTATVHLLRQEIAERDRHGQQVAAAAARMQLAFDSIQTGYTMSLQRLERTLDLCGLERIPCLGEPFDPELMEVVEVARDSGRPPNEVVEEVRPGYLWQGRVFRYAQVRVAKP